MHRSIAHPLRTLLSITLVLACRTFSVAGPGEQAKDSLRAVIVAQRTALARADSAGVPGPRIENRLVLAGSLPTSEALPLLRSAAALADSTGSLPLVLRSHTRLMERLADAGKNAEALTEAKLLVRSEHRWAEQQGDSMEAAHARAVAGYAQRNDSTAQAGALLNAALTRTLHQAEDQRTLWMGIALVACLLLVLVSAWLFQRMGKVSRTLHRSIADLQQEVTELRSVRNRRKEGSSIPDQGPVPAAAPAFDLDAAMDPVVVAMFRKSAPERLATLRSARAASDMEKTLRVVHSLKPQLVSFDAERFAPLCARITAADATRDNQRWNTDLDALERGVEDLLRRPAH